MAKKKKYKIKKAKEQEEEQSPYSRFIGNYARSLRKNRTPEEKKEYKRLALFLLGWSALVASVYIAFVQTENEFLMFAVMLVYLVAGIALFLVWLAFNGGFKKIDVSKYEKPDDMGYDEFCDFIAKIKARQQKAKYIMILFLPFFIVMLIDWYIIKLTLK